MRSLGDLGGHGSVRCHTVRTRTKEDIETIRHLYMDIDHDGLAALAKIQQSNLVPARNYTINTSPDKFQVVWRVENISQEQAESLQRAMVRKFGGDPQQPTRPACCAFRAS